MLRFSKFPKILPKLFKPLLKQLETCYLITTCTSTSLTSFVLHNNSIDFQLKGRESSTEGERERETQFRVLIANASITTKRVAEPRILVAHGSEKRFRFNDPRKLSIPVAVPMLSHWPGTDSRPVIITREQDRRDRDHRRSVCIGRKGLSALVSRDRPRWSSWPWTFSIC